MVLSCWLQGLYYPGGGSTEYNVSEPPMSVFLMISGECVVAVIFACLPSPAIHCAALQLGLMVETHNASSSPSFSIRCWFMDLAMSPWHKECN